MGDGKSISILIAFFLVTRANSNHSQFLPPDYNPAPQVLPCF